MSYKKRHIRKPKNSIFKKLWFWIALLVLAIFLTALYFLLFYPGIQLENIVISGNEKVKTQDLQDIVSKYAVTGLVNFWDIKITSTSIFFVNKDIINKNILEKFPEIEKLTISKALPQTVILNVTERKPVGAFCAEQCFLIDANGVLFELLPAVPDNLTIVRSRPSPNGEVVDSRPTTMSGSEQAIEIIPIHVGAKIIEQYIMDAIYNIQKTLKDNFQIDLKEALIASSSRLNVTTDENWQVYFNLSESSDINLQITKLDLLLEGEISAERRGKLRYIDLRPKDRAIICDNSLCAKQ